MQCVPTVAPVPCALCELSTAVVCCACYLLSRHTHTQGTLFLSNMSLCVWAAEAWCAGCMPPPPCMGVHQLRGSQLRAHLGHSCFSHGVSLVLLMDPLYLAQGVHLFLCTSKTTLGHPPPQRLFPCGMQLLCFSSGRGSRHRSLSTFLPLGRHHFPVCFYKPGCKAMGTQKLAVHVRSSACAGT